MEWSGELAAPRLLRVIYRHNDPHFLRITTIIYLAPTSGWVLVQATDISCLSHFDLCLCPPFHQITKSRSSGGMLSPCLYRVPKCQH